MANKSLSQIEAVESVASTDLLFVSKYTNNVFSSFKITLQNIASSISSLLTKATSSVFGIVKVGSNISVNNGVISLTSSNVTGALGFTPANASTAGSGDVTGPNSSTANHIATYNDATGKVIKDSGFTIGKSVPSDAKFTDTTYNVATAANGTGSDATGGSNGLLSAIDKARLDALWAQFSNSTVLVLE